jgi:hypothetical protein
MKETLLAFLEELRLEEQSIAASLSTDTLGIVFRVALNELDWYSYNIIRAPEPSRDLAEHWYMLRSGVARIVKLSSEANAAFSVPTITLRRHSELSRRVLEIACHLGFIQFGRQIADNVHAGRCEIERTSETTFDFRLPDKLIDSEAHERDVTDHYRREARRIRTESTENTSEGKEQAADIETLLENNVFIFREYFMGYHADPLLDEYFFRYAWSELQISDEFDSFNECCCFGGIPYLKYLIAAAYLFSICIKHERYCAAMVRKYPSILIEDILTISADRNTFVTEMFHALNYFGATFDNYTTTSMEEAWRIYEILSVNRRNIQIINRPATPLPCLVEFSDSAIIKLVSGRYDLPAFLLQSLRHHHPHDYDSNQRSREGSMQRALVNLMSASFPGFESRMNITIRMDGRILTDIDFVIIDSHYGDVIFCQLKFQDTYGADFRARESRMSRLLEESVGWLSAIDRWVATGEPAVRSALRLPRRHRITRIRKLIIARHHAHPLQGASLDENTAFATWPQFFNAVELMKKIQGDYRTINGLFTFLQKHIVAATTRYHYDEEPTEYCLNRIKFTVYQIKNEELDINSVKQEDTPHSRLWP